MSVSCPNPSSPVVAVDLVGRTLGSVATSPDSAYVDIIISSDGFTYARTQNGTLQLNQWLYSGKAAEYEARYQLVSGGTPNRGNGGGWHSLASDKFWGIIRNSVGTNSGVWNLQVRRADYTRILTEAEFTLTATVDPG